MKIRELGLPGVLEIVPDRHEDARGFFSETWNGERLEAAGIGLDWVQDNHSFSAPAYVLRGLHLQLAPMAQDKLVRVTRGSVFDVAVDARPGSPTFGKWVGIELSRDRWNQILVPKGYAHGFLTLEENTEVIYKVSAPYSPAHDRSIRYDDPAIGIAWPLLGHTPVLSAKDAAAKGLAEVVAETEGQVGPGGRA